MLRMRLDMVSDTLNQFLYFSKNMSQKRCFHCGLEVPDGIDLTVSYKNQEEAMCCLGCQAVAQGIIDAGLGQYYEQRTTQPNQPELPPQDILDRIKLYDLPEIQADFVVSIAENESEAVLMLSGITCAACTWLIEQKLLRLKGVTKVELNYSTQRARVAWDKTQISLSEILLTVQKLGYEACPYDATRADDYMQKERKQSILRLWVAGLSMMQVMMYAVPTYLFGDIEPQFLWILHWASMTLTLPVIFYSAVPFYRGALRDLKNRKVGMDTPITIAILLSFIASSIALFRKEMNGVFFDSISMFVFLLLGGRFLEQSARRKAADATERLVKLIPAFGHRIVDIEKQTTEECAVAQIQTDDLILVKTGEVIVADGVVVKGQSEVNEAMLTGESMPIMKNIGDTVTAGTVNIDNPLSIRVSNTGNETRLGSIVRLLDSALAQKPKAVQLADRYASVFVAILLIFAVLVFAFWAVHKDGNTALWITVSLLVITCPCALSLATPAALTAAMSSMTKIGMLMTNGTALESLSHIHDAVFDKTGTMTEGRLRLIQTIPLQQNDVSGCLKIAAALEKNSEHPIAQAFCEQEIENLPAVENLKNTIGQGIEGTIDGMTYRIGRESFVSQIAGKFPENFQHEKGTLIVLGSSQGFQAAFVLNDTIREDAKNMIQSLKNMGIRTHLLSGDHQEAVQNLAQNLGFDTYQAQATPEDKLQYVQHLQQEKRRVLMTGDGVNDAPVLAQADVSVAMVSGADVSRQGSDMVMMNDHLSAIAQAIRIAQRTKKIIHENLIWALGYNAIAIPIAAMGYARPAVAALGMALSSLLVVSNALRLLRQ